MHVAVLNGPNLNLLGRREPHIYGSSTLHEIEQLVRSHAERRGVGLEWFQANQEGALVDFVQDVSTRAAGAVVNAAAFSHTSIALRDALVGTGLPFVEAHLSNVLARESFRRRSVLADVAVGVVMGFGGPPIPPGKS